MGLLSLFSSKPSVSDDIEEMASAYNIGFNESKNSTVAFKKLASTALKLFKRKNIITAFQSREDTYSLLGVNYQELTGNHNKDKAAIKAYIYNILIYLRKDYCNPMTNEKHKNIERLIEVNLIDRVLYMNSDFVRWIDETCQAFNESMIHKKTNVIDALSEAMHYAKENGYADTVGNNKIDNLMPKYTKLISDTFQSNPTEAAVRSVIVKCLNDFIRTTFFFFDEPIDDSEVLHIIETKLFH